MTRFVWLLLLVAAPASAQNAWDPPGQTGFRRPDGWEQAPRSGGSVELGFWTNSADTVLGDVEATSVSGLARAGVVIEEVFEIGAVGGWAWGEVDTAFGAGDAASAANPLVSGTFIFSDTRFRLRAGFGLGIPAVPNESAARGAAFYGSATRGLTELWLWAPARFSMVPSFSIEAMPADFFYVDAAVRMGILIPVEDEQSAILGDPDNGEVDLVVDTQATVGFRHDLVMIGLRFRSVFLPTVREEDDQAQMSLEPFIRLTAGVDARSALVFGELRLLMNLDDELGFAFDELQCGLGDKCRGVWGMFVAFGGGV
jgi:hypothetical protein